MPTLRCLASVVLAINPIPRPLLSPRNLVTPNCFCCCARSNHPHQLLPIQRPHVALHVAVAAQQCHLVADRLAVQQLLPLLLPLPTPPSQPSFFRHCDLRAHARGAASCVNGDQLTKKTPTHEQHTQHIHWTPNTQHTAPTTSNAADAADNAVRELRLCRGKSASAWGSGSPVSRLRSRRSWQ